MHYGPVMIDLEGKELTHQESALLKHPAVGGVVLSSRNLHNPTSLKSLTQSIRSQAQNPILIFIQHEAEQASKLAHSIGWGMTTELLTYGIDLSLSPILDLTEATQALFAIDDHTLGSMLTKIKNFLRFTKLSPTLKALVPAEVIHSKMDTVPPAYSKHWLQEIRKQLKYEGAIIADSLHREGLAIGDLVLKARLALDAGCDMVMLCHPDKKHIEKVLERLDRTPSKDSQQRLHHIGKQH